MKPVTSHIDPPRRSRGVWLALVAALLLAAGLGMYFTRSKDKPTLARKGVVARSPYKNRAILERAPDQPADMPAPLPKITGTVYSTDGDILSGASLVVETFDVAGNMPSLVGSARSDSHGYFELPLRAGTYQVTARMAGYGPTSASVQSGDQVSLVMPRTGVIIGHVRDSHGDPVHRFTIDLVSTIPGDAPALPPLWSRAFDTIDGDFRVSEVALWPIVVRATSPDHAPAFSAPLSVRAGEQREVDLILTEGCTLTGTVVDRSGAPLSSVLVNAEERFSGGSFNDPTMQVASQAESDAEGAFQIDHVPLGTLMVRGYDGDKAVTTLTVDVKDCEHMPPVKLVMSDGGSLTGVARRADGKPLAGARLSLTDRSIGIVNALSGPDGRYRFDGLPPEVLRLELAYQGRSALGFVKVKDGQTVNQDMTLFEEGKGELRGRVMAGKRPIGGARLFVAMNHGREKGIAMYSPITEADGTFQLAQLPEGPYMISVISTTATGTAMVKSGEIASVDLDVSILPDFNPRPQPPRPQRTPPAP